MVSTVIPVQPFDLVIFGATGDLSHRKILPSLYRRLAVNQMPKEARIIGAARSKMTRAEFRKTVQAALEEFVDARDLKKESVEAFLATLDYVAIDASGEGGWSQLAKKLDEKPDHIRAFWETPGDVTPPGGESWHALTARVQTALTRLSHLPEVIVVAHFGPIVAAIQLAERLTPTEAFVHRIDNLSVTCLDFGLNSRVHSVNHIA